MGLFVGRHRPQWRNGREALLEDVVREEGDGFASGLAA